MTNPMIIIEGGIPYRKPNAEVLWVYQRDESQCEVEVWAEDTAQVISTLTQHGFTNIDVRKIKRG